MTCRIVRDELGNIEKVLRPNGVRSSLYDSLVTRLGDSELALDLYAVTETEDFLGSVFGGRELPKNMKHRVIETPPPILYHVTTQGDRIREDGFLKATSGLDSVGIGGTDSFGVSFYKNKANAKALADEMEIISLVNSGRFEDALGRMSRERQDMITSVLGALRLTPRDSNYRDNFLSQLAVTRTSSKFQGKPFHGLVIFSPENIQGVAEVLPIETSGLEVTFIQGVDEGEIRALGNVGLNAEPTVNEVLRYAQQLGVKPLTPEQRVDLGDLLSSVNIDMDTLHFTMGQVFYTGGVFNFNRDTAQRSLLYSEDEISFIFSDPKKVKEVSKSLKSFYEQYRSGEIMPQSAYPQEAVDFEEVGSFGKFRVVSDTEMDATMTKMLSGRVGEAFDMAVEQLPFDWVKSRYQEDSEYAQYLKDKYSDMNAVQVLDRNMNPVPRDSYYTLQRVIRRGKYDLLDDLKLLASVPIEVWEGDQGDLYSELLEAFDNLRDYNIDPKGMAELVANMEFSEATETLRRVVLALESLHRGTFTDNELRILSDIQNEAQGVTGMDVVYDNVPMGLVKVPDGIPEGELYENYNLVRAGDYYRRVEVTGDAVFEGVLDMVLDGRLDLPKQMFYPTAFSGRDTFSNKRLKDPNNRAKLLEDLKRAFARDAANYQGRLGDTSSAALAELMAYHRVYGESYSAKVPKKGELINRISGFKGRVSSIVDNFVLDFWNKKIDPRNSKAFGKFHIEDGKLVFRGNSFEAQRAMAGMDTRTKEKLKDYAAVTNTNIREMFIPEASVSTGKEERIYYTNYPEAAPRYAGDFDFKGGFLYTRAKSEKFIRVKDTLYENLGDNVYTPLLSYTGDTLVMEEQKLPPMPLERVEDKGKSQVMQIRKIPKKQIEGINERIDECIL